MLTSSQMYGLFTSISGLLFGAVIGSFINATAMRTAAGRKWWGRERSSCDHCGQELSGRDLVPIFSYILLNGNCRYCGGRIAPRHFVAEAVCSVLTAALCLKWGFGPALVLSLFTLWFSLFNSLTDIENGYIYDAWALALGVIGLVLRLLWGGTGALIDGVLGAALGGGFIAIIILASRGGMGWGDATLMTGIGAALGLRLCGLGLYSGFLCGGIVVIPLLLTKKLKRKDAIPLGPFLAAGSVLALFIGNAFFARFGQLFGFLPGWPWNY